MTGDGGVCAYCGRPIDDHNRNFRFRFPDRVVSLLDAGRLDVSDLEGDEQLDTAIYGEDVGCFLRVLLLVCLSDGYAVTFGTWLEVTSEDLEKVREVWTTPAYSELKLGGLLANAIPPWGEDLLNAPAGAAVLDEGSFPYVIVSTDPLLTQVLDDEWPHDLVLGALPS